MLTVLLAYDGSDPASRAIEVIARLARETRGLRTVLVTVRDEIPVYGDLPLLHDDAETERLEQEQQALLKMGLTKAREHGLTYATGRTVLGLPAREIVRMADEVAADQIVMGTHGRGVMGSFIIGSVAHSVIHLARTPVLLVK
jgi:nucleotide-binding universal stress UspA family protein